MKRRVLSIHKTFEEAKAKEAELMNEGADPKFLQVRRKADRFEVVVRE